MAGTTNPADHQTGPTSPMTNRKDPHQEVKQPIKPIGTNQLPKKAVNVQVTEKLRHPTEEYPHHLKKSLMQLTMMAAIKAVLREARKKVIRHANLIVADLQMATRAGQQAAANHIQAG